MGVKKMIRKPETIRKQLACINAECQLELLLECFAGAAARQPDGFYPLAEPFLYDSEVDIDEARADAVSVTRMYADAVGPLESVEALGGERWSRIRGHVDYIEGDSKPERVPNETHIHPGQLRNIYAGMPDAEKANLLRHISRDTVLKLDRYLALQRPALEEAAYYFHDSIDGIEVGMDTEKDFQYMESVFRLRPVTDSRGILDEDYRPLSDIEKCLDTVFPGGAVNSNCNVFTVEKDGYQTMVFEHSGYYACSDWIYDCVSRKMEFVPYSEKLADLQRNVLDLYDSCDYSKEVVGGNLAEDFSGKVTWSKGIDFDLPGHGDVRGLRFMVWGDRSVSGYILNHNGDSTPVTECSASVLKSVLKKMKELKRGARMNKPMRGPSLPY